MTQIISKGDDFRRAAICHTARQTLGSSNISPVHITCFLGTSFVFLYLRTFLLPNVPFVARGDQVLFFQHADRILQGQAPFQNFFAIVMPGTDLLYAGLLLVFGAHAWLPQVVVIALGLVLAGTMLWISSKILSGPVVFLPGLLFLVLDYNSALDATHHWYSTLLVMAAAGILLDELSERRLIFAGAMCGIATIFTQTRGALGMAALALYLLFVGRERKHRIGVPKQIMLLAVPYITIVGVVLGYYAVHAGTKTLAYALLYFAAKYMPTFPVYTWRAYLLQVPPHRTPGDALRMIPFAFIYLLVPFVYVLSLIRLGRASAAMDRLQWHKVFLITVIGVALFAAIATAPTYHRLCMAAPPAILVLVWMISVDRPFARMARVALWSTVLLLSLYLPLHRQLYSRIYLDLPTGRTAFDDMNIYAENKWFAQMTRPGESFFTEPQLAFALRLNNPTELDYVTPYEFTRPEQVTDVVRSLVDHKTPWIFVYPDLCASHPTGDNLGPFWGFVRANYHLVKVFPSGQFWERN